MSATLDCPGMRADNPLGFLAAIGFLRALDAEFPTLAPRLAWTDRHAVIHTAAPLPASWAATLADALKRESANLIPDRPIIKTDIPTFRREARAHLAAAHASSTGWTRLAADLQAGLATDALPPKKNENDVECSRWSFANNPSGKKLLAFMASHLAALDSAAIDRAIAGLYDAKIESKLMTVRWDPTENRVYAYRAINPDNETQTIPRFLQLFAYLGLSYLPSMAVYGRCTPAGMISDDKSDRLIWPTWTTPMESDSVSVLIAQSVRTTATSGMLNLFGSERITVGKNNFFAPAVAVPLT